MNSNVVASFERAKIDIDLDAVHREVTVFLFRRFEHFMDEENAKTFDFFLREPSEVESYLLTMSGYGLSFTPLVTKTLSNISDEIQIDYCLQMEDVQLLNAKDRFILLSGGFHAFSGILTAWLCLPHMHPKYKFFKWFSELKSAVF